MTSRKLFFLRWSNDIILCTDRNDLVKEEKPVVWKEEAGIAGWVFLGDGERESNADMEGLAFDKVIDSLFIET